jgi:PKD repeat protein
MNTSYHNSIGLFSKLFLFGCLFFADNSFSQNLEKTLQQFIQNNQKQQGWADEDIRQWRISSQHTDAHNGLSHVYIQQQFNGLDIKNSVANFSLKDGKIINMGDRLQRNISKQIQPNSNPISPDKAILAAIEQLNLVVKPNSANLQLLEIIENSYFVFNNAGVSTKNIPVKLVYQPMPEGQIVLAWDLSIEDASKSNYWSVRIDAQSAKLINKINWTQKCNFHNNTYHKCGQLHNNSLTQFANFGQNANNDNCKQNDDKSLTLNSQYRIFPLPIESPNHGARSLIINPANTFASPYGWHDIDGIMGAEYQITQGNNVHAYEDRADANAPGYSPNGGTNLIFDFSLNFNQNAQTNQDAAITNLFYLNNTIHDIFYQYGFNEASGNFQTNNYGRGGIENDYVLAEAQDGGGTNNANFSTPEDGLNGKMQMFLWTNNTSGTPNLLTVNSPSVVAGAKAAVGAGFGGALPNIPLTANLVLMVDATAPINDGCEVATNPAALANKIALVDRGLCNFVDKVYQAQLAGALACIVVNNAATAPFAMGGSNNSITIPAIMITQADGNAIKAQLATAQIVNGTIQSATGSFSLDGDFDNGVVVHEYGHGISTRLAGGANNSGCLQNAEQMGEGWSDFFALMLTQELGDAANDARGMGTYAFSEPVTGGGIRNSPYTTNMSVNNYTYGRTNDENDLTEPHGVGFVWATMLWDLNWAFCARYGFDANLYTGLGGNNTMLQLVIDGLKLQPCAPGFVDGRDAILKADTINNGAANACMIWEVFARRGLGVNASQGSSSSRTDQVENFDIPTSCQVATAPPIANCSTAVLTNCNGIFNFTDLSTSIPQGWSWTFGDGNTSTNRNPTHTYLNAGTYTVILTTTNTLGVDTASLQVTVQSPSNLTSVTNANICAGNMATLVATGTNLNTVVWLNANGNTVATGLTFTTPILNSSTTYTAENRQIFPAQNVGATTNNFGTGSMHNTNFVAAMNFTAAEPLSILSALVYSDSAGVRTFLLWDNINGTGNILQQVSVFIPAGQTRVVLNFDIPAAGNYSIGGSFMNLYRNNTGASYPYTIPNLINITGSSAGTDFYYYLYDWQVSKVACGSSPLLAMVDVLGNSFGYNIVGNGLQVDFSNIGNTNGLSWDFGDGAVSINANPTHTYSQAGTYTVTLYSNNGQCLYSQIITVVLSALQTNNNNLGWQLLPNPTLEGQNASLLFNTILNKETIIKVFASDGKKVFTQLVNAGTQQISIPSSNFSAGVYWVQAQNYPTMLKLVVYK